MEIVKVTVCLFLALFAMPCNAEVHSFKNASEKTLFRNFALSVCIGLAYEGESEKLDSNVNSAANGYREFSNISLEAYEEARFVIQQWLKKDYKSKHGGQINIMKCIDLYNHNDLIDVYKKYNPCNSKGSWLDPNDFKLRCE